MTPTQIETNPGWQLTPEMQAALDSANARLAQLAEQHMPADQSSATPPLNARALVEWGRIKLKPEGEALLDDQLSSRDYYQLLVEHDCLADARRILAHALPKRRALWWGVLAAYDAFRAPPPELERVLKLVTRFTVTPTEDLRRAAGELAQRTAPNTIAGCLATAAFFSSGSVSPPGLPPVAPRPFVTGRLVGVCVYLASVTRDPARYKQYLREYLRWGEAIAAGQLLWSAPAPQPTPAPSRLGAYWPTAEALIGAPA